VKKRSLMEYKVSKTQIAQQQTIPKMAMSMFLKRSRSKVQILWYHLKGLVTINTHVNYESPSICHLNVLVKVISFFNGKS
jgi:hypothetical protein